MGADTIPIGRVLSNTFALIRDRAGIVFGMAFLTTAPIRLWVWTLPTLTYWMHLKTVGPAFAFGMASAVLVNATAYMFGQAALAGVALSRPKDEGPGFSTSLGSAARQLPTIIPLACLSSLGVAVGFIALIIPGFFLSAAWSVLGPIAGAEKRSIMDSFRRSQSLTENLLWPIFLLFLVGGLGTAGFSWATERISQALGVVDRYGLDSTPSVYSFLFGSAVEWIKTAFNLALPCALYVLLVERRGDGPMRQRLSEIFA
jgi:hypothetical protein